MFPLLDNTNHKNLSFSNRFESIIGLMNWQGLRGPQITQLKLNRLMLGLFDFPQAVQNNSDLIVYIYLKFQREEWGKLSFYSERL